MSRAGAGKLVLGVLLTIVVVRLLVFVVAVGERSLQMDLSAFYTAGRAAAAGLSPYVNHVGERPSLWDGVDTYRHSRFLYPPLVARAFRPLAALPYHAAKYVWLALSLGALAGALALAARLARAARPSERPLALAVAAAAFHPLFTLLERGQSDSLTLLMMMAAVWWMRNRSTSLAAGVLLALATLLKLHCVFIVPFLLVRRRWRVLAGFSAGGLLLLIASLVTDGAGGVAGYLTEELPRISRYGERGTAEMRLPPAVGVPLQRMLATGRTVMDGRSYDVELFAFTINASAVRTPVGHAVWTGLRRLAPALAPAQVSLVFLLAGWLLLAGWQLRFGEPDRTDTRAELVYWQCVLVVILLSAPTTWVMGTVWLLPIGAIVLGERDLRGARLVAAGVCVCGLLGAGLPDPPGALADYRLVVAESVCLAGLLGRWAADSTPTSRDTP